MTERGALPGRYPGIFANRAKLFAIASHSFATSLPGSSICSFETDPGCFSTSTFIGHYCSGHQQTPQNSGEHRLSATVYLSGFPRCVSLTSKLRIPIASELPAVPGLVACALQNKTRSPFTYTSDVSGTPNQYANSR